MFAETGSIRVYYELRGENGSKVVLLHGWGCTAKLMENLADSLSKDHQVLLIDFPGHGKSDNPPEPWGVPEFALCLKELLEQLHFTPCAAVGHSFGCRVAAWAAAEWPEMFTRLVFTGAAGIRPAPTKEGQKRAQAYQKKKKIVSIFNHIPLLKREGEKMQKKLQEKYGSRDYNALDDEMKKTFIKVINFDLREIYPLIRQSTLLIWGDSDTETPLWMGTEMEKLIPDAGLVILEGGSHFAYLEQANRFNTIVYHFLTEE